MKKIVLLLLIAAGISFNGFSMKNNIGGTKDPQENQQNIKSHRSFKITQPTILQYCTEVEIYLICGGSWSGNICHEGVALTSQMFHAAANLKDLQLCGYTYTPFTVIIVIW